MKASGRSQRPGGSTQQGLPPAPGGHSSQGRLSPADGSGGCGGAGFWILRLLGENWQVSAKRGCIGVLGRLQQRTSGGQCKHRNGFSPRVRNQGLGRAASLEAPSCRFRHPGPQVPWDLRKLPSSLCLPCGSHTSFAFPLSPKSLDSRLQHIVWDDLGQDPALNDTWEFLIPRELTFTGSGFRTQTPKAGPPSNSLQEFPGDPAQQRPRVG